jgi:hypothetical protein
MTETHRGRCFCGSVTFEIDTPIKWCVLCHCESCRRQCSSPLTAFVCVDHGQWRLTGAPPKIHRSSPGVERTFCGDCGSAISFCSQNMSGLMNFHVAAMDEPELFVPTLHVAYEEKLPWLHVADDLKKGMGPRVLDN